MRLRSRFVGVLSDTHGLLRPQALAALSGADFLIHAGDIGGADLLSALRSIAPTHAVRGNIDTQSWAAKLPSSETIVVEGRRLHVLHVLADLDVDPSTVGYDAVISGHSHRPSVARRGGVLFLNPGSAGPRRFSLPVTVARLFVERHNLRAEIVPLDV
jgi:putative phosphoesterase